MGVVTNCTFEYNSAVADNNNSHAGALCFKPGTKVSNCTFIGNSAYQGGATTFHAEGNLDNCIFINNTAIGYGGAISTGYGESGIVVIQEISISNSYFEGNSAPIGGAIATKGTSVNVTDSNFVSNKASENGGAIFIMDDGINVLNSNFTNNVAKKYAGAIYVNGSNVNVHDSNFNNNSAEFSGAIRVYGNNVSINKSKFTNNKAISNGFSKAQIGAVGIFGSNVNVTNAYFTNNSAEGDGGALGVIGDNVNIFNSEFYYNHATPFNNDLNTGMGGAIYNIGHNIVYDNAIFKYNSAVNGSAMYISGSANLNNIVFYKNQAYTYALPVIVQNIKNKYGTTVNVTVTIIGGNNIANAIHYIGVTNDISFNNVTYLFNVNGTITNRTTGSNEIHPVVGVENSKNGTLIYIDDRENTQLIKPIVIHDESGNVIFNETLISSIMGDVRFSLSNLAPGIYNVEVDHPEDLFYKAIKNQTKFEVEKLVDLDVSIITNKEFYVLNEEVEWTITLTNHGPHSDDNCYVSGIKLDDIIEFNPSKGNFDATTGMWKIGKLAQNETITLKIKTNAAKLGTVTLTVNAVNSTQDSNISNNIATKSVHVQEPPIVVPVKYVNVTNPNYGDKVKYTIVVSNLGNISANTRLFDILDDGLIFIEASGKYNWNPINRTITWDITELEAGENLTFYVYATANAYGVLNNTAIIGDNNYTRNITVPEITPNKTVDKEVPNFGDNITYTVTITNGEIGANNVIVKDIVGEGLTVTDISDNGKYDPITRTIIWTVNLAKNEVKTFTVNVTVLKYGNINNIVTVGNKSVVKNITVPEIIPNKTVNNIIPNFGDEITYTISVSNKDIVGAVNVVVVDHLAKGLRYISSSNNGVYDSVTHSVTWVVNITALSTLNLTVTTSVEDYGKLTNNVTVGDNNDSVDVSVPEITPNKTVNIENPNFGDDVTYTVTVTNDGFVDSKQVIVRDVLGSGLKFVSASHNGKYDDVTRTITWIVDLTKGESRTFYVVATVSGYGNLTNQVTVGNKNASVNVTVPEITPNKTVNIENPNFGDDVTYTVTANNIGKTNATNVIVVDKLGEGLTFINASNGGVYNPVTRTITWIVNLTAGETKVFYVNARISAYGNITNTVIVGNKTVIKNVVVPEMVVVKEVNSSNIHVGDEITYTITVSNPGKNNVINLIIKDVLPEGLKFINASNGGVYDSVTKTITWIINITANSTVKLTVDVEVIKSGNITNTVNVGNKTIDCTIESGEIVDLEIHIVVDKSTTYIGDTIIYTVTVINNGPGNAINTISKVFIPNTLSVISYNATKGTFDMTSSYWSIGNLTNGEKVVLTFIAKVLNKGNLTIKVNVTSKTFEKILENNYDNVTVKVLEKPTPVIPDKPANPNSTSNNQKLSESGKTISLPNTGNPLIMLLLCMLSVIFAGSKKRKI